MRGSVSGFMLEKDSIRGPGWNNGATKIMLWGKVPHGIMADLQHPFRPLSGLKTDRLSRNRLLSKYDTECQKRVLSKSRMMTRARASHGCEAQRQGWGPEWSRKCKTAENAQKIRSSSHAGFSHRRRGSGRALKGAGQVFRVEKGSRRSAETQARDQAGVTRDMRHVPGRGVI